MSQLHDMGDAFGPGASLQSSISAAPPIAAPSPKEPALNDIEQYRIQMAAISTAALGYWTENDSIPPEYDTPALRDVAKLYAKYDMYFKLRHQPAPEHQAPVALNEFDVSVLIAENPRDRELVRAAIAEFCRINSIPAPKEHS